MQMNSNFTAEEKQEDLNVYGLCKTITYTYLHYTGWSHETLECLQHLTQVIRKHTHTLAVLQMLPISCEMETVCG